MAIGVRLHVTYARNGVYCFACDSAAHQPATCELKRALLCGLLALTLDIQSASWHGLTCSRFLMQRIGDVAGGCRRDVLTPGGGSVGSALILKGLRP
jgi:hypothetical protein